MGVPIWRPKSPPAHKKHPRPQGGLHPDFLEWAERRTIPGFLAEDHGLQRRHSIRRRLPRRIRTYDNLHELSDPNGEASTSTSTSTNTSTNTNINTNSNINITRTPSDGLPDMVSRLYSNLDLPGLVRSGTWSAQPPANQSQTYSAQQSTPSRPLWASSRTVVESNERNGSLDHRVLHRLPVLYSPGTHGGVLEPPRDSILEPLPPPPVITPDRLDLTSYSIMPNPSSSGRPQVHFTNPPETEVRAESAQSRATTTTTSYTDPELELSDGIPQREEPGRRSRPHNAQPYTGSNTSMRMPTPPPPPSSQSLAVLSSGEPPGSPELYSTDGTSPLPGAASSNFSSTLTRLSAPMRTDAQPLASIRPLGRSSDSADCPRRG